VAHLDRGIVHWSGGQIGSGVSVFYAIPGSGLMPMIRTFFEAIKIDIANVITLTYDSGGDTIESTNGNLVGSWSGTSLTATTGGGGGFNSAPTGGVVDWLTNTIFPATKPTGAPHRGRGHTFIVPIATNSYDSDGTLNNTTVSRWKTAADALVASAAGGMVIYHRHTAPGATDGTYGPVVDTKVRDRVAVLTSRR